MHRLLATMLLLLLAAPTAAQVIPIKDHPQKAEYASPAEWGHYSAQFHWKPQPQDPDVLGHVHLELTAPAYGVVEGVITVGIRVVMFHIQGTIHPADPNIRCATEYRWDDGHVGVPGRPLAPHHRVGDPSGLKVITGEVTVDANCPKLFRGWNDFGGGLLLLLDNGDAMRLSMAIPIYAPNNPKERGWNLEPQFKAAGIGGSDRGRDMDWGVIEIANYPIAPIDAPYNIDVQLTGYAGGLRSDDVIADREHFLVKDPALHAGDSGETIYATTSNKSFIFTLEPFAWGDGPHRLMAKTTRTTDGADPEAFFPGEEGVTLLVLPVVIGDAPPPPPPPVPTQYTVTVDGRVVAENASIAEASQAVGDALAEEPDRVEAVKQE